MTAVATTRWVLREQLLFPEIEYDKVEKIRGMEMIFVTTAKTDEEVQGAAESAGYALRAGVRKGGRIKWLRLA